MSEPKALIALAKIGGHVRVDEIARSIEVSARKAHDELGELIDQGLVAESTWYRLTDEGISKLRAAGVICTGCLNFLRGDNPGGRCPTCRDHDVQREAFEERRARARESAKRGKGSKPLHPRATPGTRAAAERRAQAIEAGNPEVRQRDEEVLKLRRKGFGPSAIALRLGIPYATAYNSLSRLRKAGRLQRESVA